MSGSYIEISPVAFLQLSAIWILQMVSASWMNSMIPLSCSVGTTEYRVRQRSIPANTRELKAIAEARDEPMSV